MLVHHRSRYVIQEALPSKLYDMQEKYRNAFLGYGPEDTNFCLELTENYDKDNYDLGTGFGHFALALPDVYKTCDSIKKAGDLHICIAKITNITILVRITVMIH